MVSERSLGSFLLGLLAIGLLATSLLLPWFSYAYSSGRRTAEGGLHDPDDTGVIHQSWEASPQGWDGTITPTDPARADQVLLWTLAAVAAALVLTALAILGDLPGIDRVLVRPAALALHAAAFAASGAALALTWFALPGTLSGYGVTGPFTSFLDDTGYTQTTLRVGWSLAALALAPMFGAFLFKFQAGAPDPTAVADLASQGDL